jgi:hypothetical protein
MPPSTKPHDTQRVWHPIKRQAISAVQQYGRGKRILAWPQAFLPQSFDFSGAFLLTMVISRPFLYSHAEHSAQQETLKLFTALYDVPGVDINSALCLFWS